MTRISGSSIHSELVKNKHLVVAHESNERKQQTENLNETCN